MRLTVAAFLLSAWVAAGLASGIAHADDPSPSGSKSSSDSSADAPKAAKVDAPKRSASADAPGANVDRKPGTTTESSPSESKTTAGETATDSKPPIDDVKPWKPEPVADADPADPPKPPTRGSSHRPGLTIASAKPAKPIAADPQPSATGAPSQRSAVASAPQPSTQASSQRPAVAAVAAADPSPSISGPNTQQVIGLVTDVGTVAASVVYTVADTVAQAFGPHSFLGVPYALATAVANSAAAVSRTLIGAPPGSVSTGPFPVNYGIINGLTFLTPQKPPPGANDPSITVTADILELGP